MKAVVTGVAGFVGSNIARRLLRQGAEVLGIDSFTSYYAFASRYSRELKHSNLNSLTSPGFTFVPADLNEIDLDIVDDVDVIYHQAGQPGVRSSWGCEFGLYVRNNVQATQRLLEAARRSSSLRRFVYASSSSVYGTAERFPTLETDIPRPFSPYGVTKLAGEHLVSLYGTNFGVPTVSLRYFTVYGPGQRPDMAFNLFLQAALTGGEITIFGSGEQIRDFTFIDDVVNANLLASTSDSTRPGEVINVSGGSNFSVNDVLTIIAELTGADLNIRKVARADGDVARTRGSSDHAAEVLGWHSSVTIREGLKRQLEWLRATQAIWTALPADTV